MAKKETKRLSLRAALPGIANSGIDEIIGKLDAESEVEYGAFFDVVERLYPTEWDGGVSERIRAANTTISRAINNLPDTRTKSVRY